MNEQPQKKCVICFKEYEPKETPTGQEQKYCSSTCRNKAAYKRREENILAKFGGQVHTEPTHRDDHRYIHRDDHRYIQGHNLNYADIGTPKIIEMIQDTAELRAENKRLIDKVQQLEMDKAELINELEDVPDDNSMGSIGKMITDYAPLIISYLNTTTNGNKTTPTA